MATHYSPAARVLVNEMHARIRPLAGQMVWKPVALALAEVLLKFKADYESERAAEYNDYDSGDRNLKDYIDIEVWKWLEEVKCGNA